MLSEGRQPKLLVFVYLQSASDTVSRTDTTIMPPYPGICRIASALPRLLVSPISIRQLTESPACWPPRGSLPLQGASLIQLVFFVSWFLPPLGPLYCCVKEIRIILPYLVELCFTLFIKVTLVIYMCFINCIYIQQNSVVFLRYLKSTRVHCIILQCGNSFQQGSKSYVLDVCKNIIVWFCQKIIDTYCSLLDLWRVVKAHVLTGASHLIPRDDCPAPSTPLLREISTPN